jgi:hypothetical protein
MSKGEEDMDTSVGGRKITQPKGKVRPVSDIHMAELKRMDLVASHPSAFGAQPDRLTTATTSSKRTQSKAKLDVVERPSWKEQLRNSQFYRSSMLKTQTTLHLL